MKRIVMFMLLIGMLVACKKETPTPEPIKKDITIWAELYGDKGRYMLDSTEFRVCIQNGAMTPFSLDTTYAFTVYSGVDGKATMKLPKKGAYCVVATSKTYKMSYESEPHYYKKPVFFNVEDFNNTNTYLSSALTTYFETKYRITGYGISNYFIQDPSE